ncbi:MAG: hypothetical protein K8F27_09675 [Sulfuricellaceae bacterium]|nr:hypothetical protein [Sulfuricellaceae bacterium]
MKSDERHILHLFRSLSSEQQATLTDFAEFLAQRGGEVPDVPSEPLAIPRPAEESLVKAVKRLRETYPMLDPGKLLDETAHQMTQHVMHGKPAKEAIDELEAVFGHHYRLHRDGSE